MECPSYSSLLSGYMQSLPYSFLSVPSLLIIPIRHLPTHSYQFPPYSSFISIPSLLIIHINHFPTHHSYQSLSYSSFISIPSLLITHINPFPTHHFYKPPPCSPTPSLLIFPSSLHIPYDSYQPLHFHLSYQPPPYPSFMFIIPYSYSVFIVSVSASLLTLSVSHSSYLIIPMGPLLLVPQYLFGYSVLLSIPLSWLCDSSCQIQVSPDHYGGQCPVIICWLTYTMLQTSTQDCLPI